jgi:hypothetical protein
MLTVRSFLVGAALCATVHSALADRGFIPPRTFPNHLDWSERRAGWKLLFDGKTTSGWRSFKKDAFPAKGWNVEHGVLHCLPNGKGGDIISLAEFDDFDLRWEWMIPPKANSGVKYFITEERSEALGHEYQMIDDNTVNDQRQSTAAFYDVLPPAANKPLRRPGQWNESRVLVIGNHVEHWLNGAEVLTYELGSHEVLEAVGKSKFKYVKGFGTKIRGHILLTEHHDEASFRNIRIRELHPR